MALTALRDVALGRKEGRDDEWSTFLDERDSAGAILAAREHQTGLTPRGSDRWSVYWRN